MSVYDRVALLGQPTLVNEYALHQGSVWTHFEYPFFNLFEIWEVLRRPVRLHPLRWLHTLKAQEQVTLVYRVFPTNAKNSEGFPVDAVSGWEKKELFAFAAAFVKDSSIDDGEWDSPYAELWVNPAVAHAYISRVYPRFKHTWVRCDPNHQLNYRGFTLRGSYPRPDLPRIYDIGGLDPDPRERLTPQSDFLKFLKSRHQQQGFKSVMTIDTMSYAAKILERYGSNPYVFEKDADIATATGLSKSLSDLTSQYFDQATINQMYAEVKVVRDQFYMTRRGSNSYILTTAEMSRFLIEQLLLHGFLTSNGFF